MDDKLKRLLVDVLDELMHTRLQENFISLGHALGQAIDDLFGRKIEFVLVLRNPDKDVISLGTMDHEQQIEALLKAAKRLENKEFAYAITRDGETTIVKREEMEQEAKQETKH